MTSEIVSAVVIRAIGTYIINKILYNKRLLKNFYVAL